MARRHCVGLAVVVGAVIVAVLGSAPAADAAADGIYPDWQRAGSSGAWTGHGDLAAAGFPVVDVISNATALTTPSGVSAFLGSGTPFGQVFGSSQGQPYVNLSTAQSFAASTTTLSFAGGAPAAGWGFALGDVDADAVKVTALDAHGDPVATADLGWQSAFNYCVNSPKPSSCAGSGPFTDIPVWDPATSTLTGNGVDTFGASGWFEPSVSLSKLTLTFTRQSGSPIFQLWLAALAVPVSGKVDGVTPADPPPAPGVELDLQKPDGTAVVEPSGDPVIAKTDDHGAFTFPDVVDGDYRIAIDPPARTEITGDHHVDVVVDPAAGATQVPAGAFAVHVTPKATPSPSPSRSRTSTSAASVTAEPELAATGADALPLALLAGVLIVGGCGLALLGRSGRRG